MTKRSTPFSPEVRERAVRMVFDHHLKTLRGRTPYEFICQAWTKQPERFRIDPSHHMPGPNI